MASSAPKNVPEIPPTPAAAPDRAGDGAGRFRLTRHFAVTSLLGLIAVLAVLLAFYRHSALTAIMDQEARANESLAQVFANSIWPSYDIFVSNAGKLPPETLRARPETGLLHQDVVHQMKGLNVAKVKIY